jgi:CIC family chloride channel protein
MMQRDQKLPVAPSMSPVVEETIPRHVDRMPRRNVMLTAIAVALAAGMAFVAQLLTRLIALVTNLAFFHRVSFAQASPADAHLGLWVILVPAIGGLIVGLMARYGSQAIRGHGIPEAMEKVLLGESRIPKRITLLKPLSAAIAIGTGGPFGAEGPIIATGGATGSLIGQLLPVSADERKTLLCAGAAAGMAATFGTPISAVLLALELLLFEYKARSLIPVALAVATATAIRGVLFGWEPVFGHPDLAEPTGTALLACVGFGLIFGVLASIVTNLVYAIEDAFEKLPIHWMWWPALGALVTGIVGYFAPRTLGVGYNNIEDLVTQHLDVTILIALSLAKFVSWSIALGSGTSGGTLAPLFTIGGAIGAFIAMGATHMGVQVDVRLGALVGMAAMFAGCSHAVLASIVFAFETTHSPQAILPLLITCLTAYFVATLISSESIMTKKLSRRGQWPPSGFAHNGGA